MSQLQTISIPMPARFPFSGMACPEPGCNTAVYTTYPKLVQHWKLVHTPTVLLHTCRVCMKTFTRKPDTNRHLKACHNAFVYQSWFPNRRYRPPTMPMPVRIPAVMALPSRVLYPESSDQTTQTERQEARAAAQQERQRLAAGSAGSGLATRELDNIFPDQRPFTLTSPYEVQLDYTD